MFGFDVIVRDNHGKVRTTTMGARETAEQACAELRRHEMFYLNIGYTEIREHSELQELCGKCRGNGKIWVKKKRSRFGIPKDCSECGGKGTIGEKLEIDWNPTNEKEQAQLAETLATGRMDQYY